MSTPENHNPFDQTIWNPVNPEHPFYEDPLHGPSAVHSRLEVPSMPDGDGTYYQSGLGPFGPDRFDAKGQPLIRVIGRSSSTFTSTGEPGWAEWAEAYRNGGEPMLTILEGERQRERLEKNGVAHAFKPSDVCGGSKRLDECETGSAMVQAAQESASKERPKAPGKGRTWNMLAWLSRECMSCSLHCEVTYEIYDGEPTGITRLSNSQSLEADFPVVRVDLLGR